MSMHIDSTRPCRILRAALIKKNEGTPVKALLGLYLLLAGTFQIPAFAQATKSVVPNVPPPGGKPGSVQYCTDLGNDLSTLQKAYDALPPGEKNDDQTQEDYNLAASGLKYDWTVQGCGGLVMPSGCTDQNLCPPASLPTSSGTVVNLGGAVNIPFSAFDLGSAPRKPILSKPFTATEILAVAPPGRIQNGVLGQFVKNKAGKLIPLSTYVAQLNSMETFLNGYGYTLRDGALAAAGDKMSPEKLGLQFKLRSIQPLPNALVERTVGTTPFPLQLPFRRTIRGNSPSILTSLPRI